MKHCFNHDVATGKYDCPYADVVNNTICCTGKECNHIGMISTVVNNLTKEQMCKLHSGAVYGNSVFAMITPTPYEDIAANLLANSLKDEEFPF